MLLSQYEGRISEKRQVGFPKKFRAELGDTLIITKGFDKQLLIVGQKYWETLLAGTEETSFIDKNAREVQRFLLGNAVAVTIDAKGRFIVPAYLKEYAGIEEDIVFVGVNKYIEVWSKKAWEEQQAYLAQNIPSITERLSEKELGK